MSYLVPFPQATTSWRRLQKLTGLCVDLAMHSVAHDKEGSDKGDKATNMNVAPIFLSALCNSQMLCVNIDFHVGL